MSCDINLYMEGRRKTDDRWTSLDKWTHSVINGFDVDFYDSFYAGSSYIIFKQIAGVKDYYYGEDVPVRFEPRGMPEDASKPVRDVYQNYPRYLYSPSYLYLEELQTIDPMGRNGWLEFMKKLEPLSEIYKEPESLRAVFWFCD